METITAATTEAVVPRADAESVPEPIASATRGRGRPRNDWTAQEQEPIQEQQPILEQQLIQEPQGVDSDLNLTQAELLYQFITQTGPGLAGPNPAIAQFWALNAPLLGISHPSLLRLCLSLAAHHLAFRASETENHNERARYIAVAERHFSIGLAQTNEALAAIDASTCGSLYVSTILVCFCCFAAGPRGHDDLFVCSVDGSSSQPWLPLARGARLLRDLFAEEILFSGLTEPLSGRNSPPDDPRPTCVCEGFVRLDWVDQIERLRTLVASSATPSKEVYAPSLAVLSAIYEGTFGDDEGRVKCPLYNKMPLVWIYTMQDDFVECLQKEDNVALLLLAYYAPLVKTMKRDWFLHGWAEHILGACRMYVTGGFAEFLEWPAKAVAVLGDD